MRRAISLLELIFAIIVMGIALLAVPSLFEQSSKNIERLIKNEEIFQAFRSLNIIMSYRWDENSSLNDRIYILDVHNGCNELNRSTANPLYRRSLFTGEGRRVFYSSPLYPNGHLGLDDDDNNIADDSDDFQDITEDIVQYFGDYLLSFSLIHTFSYMKDSNSSISYDNQTYTLTIEPTNDETNIKLVTTNVVENGKTIVTMRAFVSNIGEALLLSKVAK